MIDWQELDARHVWHPYTQMALMPEATPVVRGEGAYLYLADGSRLFDAISSWWVTLHGHAEPRIAAAIAKQASVLEQVIFAGFTHEPAARLAAALIGVAPEGLSKVFYSDDGSTAVEVALKMALQFWRHHGERRTRFLALEHAYHGDTFGAMSVSARGVFTSAFDSHLFEVTRLPFPEPPARGESGYSASELRFLEALRSAASDTSVAGFIYEPLLLGAGGMRLWRPEILGEAMQIAREQGILCIADEVLTGFGRTGKMWASDRTAGSPDIMTLSKGITGGFMAFGATLASDRIYEAFLSEDRTKTFFHGHSYTANPIACAAALASLGIFSSDPVMERIAMIEGVHEARLPGLAEEFGLGFRALGTIGILETPASDGYLGKRFARVVARTRINGLYLRPLGDVIYLMPPYCTTSEELHWAYDTIRASLRAR